MFWNAYRRVTDRSKRATGNQAGHRVVRLAESVRQLEDKVDQLALTCQALWEVLRAHSDLDDSEILEKVTEIDLRDGRADGKLSPRTRLCPQCERVLHARHRRCMYCGASAPSEQVFDL